MSTKKGAKARTVSEKNALCQLCGKVKTYHGIPYTICDSCYPIIERYMKMREAHSRIWKRAHGTDLSELRQMLKDSPIGIDGELHLNELIDDLEEAMTKIDGATIALHNLFVTPKIHLLKEGEEVQHGH